MERPSQLHLQFYRTVIHTAKVIHHNKLLSLVLSTEILFDFTHYRKSAWSRWRHIHFVLITVLNEESGAH